MRILVFTNMYPFKEIPYYGIFIQQQVESLRKLGLEVDVLFINGRKSKLEYFKAPFLLLKYFKKKKYDIIHAHHTYCAFIGLFLKKNVPLLLTFHEGEFFYKGNYLERIKKMGFFKSIFLSNFLKRYILQKVDHIITVYADKEKFKSIPRNKLSVIPPGVDLNLFRPLPKEIARAKLGISLYKKIILFPADPERKEKRYDKARLVIELLNKEGISVELLSLGGVPYHKVPLYINAADVVLLTSDFEASPMVVKESMACNIPIVAPDVGDIKELFDNLEGYFLVEDDVSAICEGVKRALNFIGQANGRSKIIEKGLDVASIALQIKEVYEKYKN